MGRATPACDAMSEPGASGFTDLCVGVAVDIEFKIAASLLSGKSFSSQGMKICRGLFGGRRITILQSGMGAVGFAERLGKHLTNNRYDALIIAGLAGGVDPRPPVGGAGLFHFFFDAPATPFYPPGWPRSARGPAPHP